MKDLLFIERTGWSLHIWVGPFGAHLFRGLVLPRLDFCRKWGPYDA